ncbi:EAL domain-containing protein [Modestobacter sp. NPDC049651]|uniref:putative bifunctional diguanylate cyclase/phosphodiesterase n=1 Tax=unclassified Modestobacter TaxID=2643866 RepID=UPI0034064D73
MDGATVEQCARPADSFPMWPTSPAGDGRTAPVDRRLRVLRRVSAAGVAAYAVLVAAQALGVPGSGALLLGGGYSFFLALLAAVVLVRALLYREGRAAWLCFAAALGSYLAGNAAYALGYDHRLSEVRPFLPDAGWMGFYPLAYVALLLMLRNRVGRLTASTWVDGLVTGLTAAAFGAAFAVGAVLDATHGSPGVVATSLAYPIGDSLLLVLLLGCITVIGRGAGPAWWWLSAGMALFAVTDVVYVLQVARETFRAGTLLDLGWGVAFLCFGMAALQVPRAGRSRRLEGRSGLVLPGICAVAALVLLFLGYLQSGDVVAGGLALAAVLAALTRTLLSFREVRALADSRRQARTDELTGLPNRRAVYEALGAADAALARGDRLAVLVVDLDRFKEINDSLGHAAGDLVLREVAPRLAGQLRSGDLVGRLGGDEFVVLAADLDAAGAHALAGRLREELQRPFRLGALSLTVDASIGVAAGPGHSAAAEELLQLADLAMYSAKAARTGPAVYDDARDGEGRHRLETLEELRAGIAGGQLLLHFQPKLDLRSGQVHDVEALVRWQHPDRGLLYPDAFVDLAESGGLMPRLTAAVLDLALAQCRAWRDGGRELGVSVNVSPSDLVDPAFPGEVAAALLRHALPASVLVLEVTETLLVADRVRAAGVLEQLRTAGVGISIDDYGTGYSSLAYLASLPVTELKLDRSFLADMPRSARAAAVVASTLQLAQSLGLVLVAEGAEDQETVSALQGMACDVVQGYHISRPLPAAQLDEWLAARRVPVT